VCCLGRMRDADNGVLLLFYINFNIQGADRCVRPIDNVKYKERWDFWLFWGKRLKKTPHFDEFLFFA
ncbi:hypothetical protein, partial [Avibacterium paragallinarum]|uniref:hypothetical protein n=1 Tax=Avibacterium paragallinarum TaxID=728 RepID=UPI001A929627